MSWYIKAQEQLNLFNPDDVPKILPQEEGDFFEEMEDAKGIFEIRYIAQKHGYNTEFVTFPEADPVIVIISNNKVEYVIDDFNYPQLAEPQEWVDGIGGLYLSEYIDVPEENFWNGVTPGYKVYHGTSNERLEDIMKNGLEARSETRGVTNRWTPPGVFASQSPEDAYRYDRIIEIDVGLMKTDGYMPQVSGEEPIEESKIREAIAWSIGFQDYLNESYSSDGLEEGTIIFFGDIPVKYLTLLPG